MTALLSMPLKDTMNTTAWTLHLVTPQEKQTWNQLVQNNPDGGTFLQTVQFGDIKKHDGWRPLYLMYHTPYGKIAALALTRYIFPLGELWYFPKGPGIAKNDDLRYVVSANKRFVRQHKLNVFLIKMEPEILRNESPGAHRELGDLVPAPPVQAHASTVVVSLSASNDILFRGLYKRAQKNTRLGERERTVIAQAEPVGDNFRIMYDLMKTVAGGRGPRLIRPYSYYARFWKTFISAGMGRLYFAYENGKPVVGAFIIITGNKAVYKDGGSLPGRRSKAAAYSLQWRVMRDAAACGVALYDLCGVPPSDRITDSSHYLFGVGFSRLLFLKPSSIMPERTIKLFIHESIVCGRRSSTPCCAAMAA